MVVAGVGGPADLFLFYLLQSAGAVVYCDLHNRKDREMDTIQMALNINIAGGDNWQERLADALLAIQSHVRESEKLRIADTLDGNDFTAHYTLFGEIK
jgi:hypothetical protein